MCSLNHGAAPYDTSNLQYSWPRCVLSCNGTAVCFFAVQLGVLLTLLARHCRTTVNVKMVSFRMAVSGYKHNV